MCKVKMPHSSKEMNIDAGGVDEVGQFDPFTRWILSTLIDLEPLLYVQ